MNEPTNYVPAMYSNHKRVPTLSSSLLPCCLSHGLVETLAISSPSSVFFYNIYPLQLIKRFDVKIRGMSMTYQTLVFRGECSGCLNIFIRIFTTNLITMIFFMRCCYKFFKFFNNRICNIMCQWLL
jgi:hypothetical protein